ncbi:MAG: hypothetical protein QM681_09815 [Novosphingobium sp.]
MGVRIEARQGHRLHLTGDIETVLDVPARDIEEGFSLAFSDGTLVRGTYLAGTDACRFAIASEGAAMVRFLHQETGEALDMDWDFDWITLACGGETLRPEAVIDGDDVLQLTLDIEVRDAA